MFGVVDLEADWVVIVQVVFRERISKRCCMRSPHVVLAPQQLLSQALLLFLVVQQALRETVLAYAFLN